MKSSVRIGAATVMGGIAAWVWMQARRRSAVLPHREISRWEDEGGAVTGDNASLMNTAAGAPASANGVPAEQGSQRWAFPTGH